MVRHRPKPRRGSLFGRNPRVKTLDPLVRLKAVVDEEGSVRKAAQEIGISAAYLGDLLRGRREPGDKVLQYLGLKKVVYRTVRYQEEKTNEG